MDLQLHHVEVHVTSVDRAREFYVDKLGLPVLDDMPDLNLLAVRAGPVRISIFGGYQAKDRADTQKCGTHLIFRTDNLDRTIDELRTRGVHFPGTVIEAGGFIKDIATQDPDGNIIEFAEYLRDPLT